MSVILATQEAKISSIKVQSQPGQIVKTPYLENTYHKKKRAGRVAHSEGPEFKPQYWKKNYLEAS
jgi:hypothetical protein